MAADIRGPHSLPTTGLGVRWQIGKVTVAHVFGREDQRFRVTFRAELDEVLAFEHLGEPGRLGP